MNSAVEYTPESGTGFLYLDLTRVVEANGRLKQEFTTISDSFGWRAVIVQWGLLLALLGALPLSWALGGPILSLPLVPLLGLAAYRLTILTHDCAHNTLFSSRKMNTLVGRLTGWMVGSDFEEFRRLHWLHHRRFGKTDDPQGRDYMGLTKASKATVIWHLARPLLGFNVFKLGGFIPTPNAADRPAGATRKRLTFLAGVAAMQVFFAAIASGFGIFPLLVVFYPAAAATFGLFFSQTRGFCEHVPPADGVSEEHLRTHESNWFDRIFFYALNFNYHVEHHLFPAAPSCRLPQLHRVLQPQLRGGHSLSPSILNTIRARLSQCKQ